MGASVNVFFVFLPLFLLGVLFFVFWVFMLIDSATRKFKKDVDKIVWVVVNVVVGFIGSLIYYFVVYYPDKSKSMRWFWFTLLGIFVLFLVLTLLVLIALPAG